jgi:hypothetical protein
MIPIIKRKGREKITPTINGIIETMNIVYLPGTPLPVLQLDLCLYFLAILYHLMNSVLPCKHKKSPMVLWLGGDSSFIEPSNWICLSSMLPFRMCGIDGQLCSIKESLSFFTLSNQLHFFIINIINLKFPKIYNLR